MVYRLNVKEKQKNDHNRTFLFSYLLAHSLDRSIGFVDDFFFRCIQRSVFCEDQNKRIGHTLKCSRLSIYWESEDVINVLIFRCTVENQMKLVFLLFTG